MSRNLMDLFAEASEISGAGERAAFLDEACGGDAELRARVEKLLGAHEQVGDAKGFLGGPEGPDGSALTGAGTEPASGEVGRYKLLQKIGEGGWGIVYMAEQTEPVRRRVALKIIKPGMDSRQVLARFEAERQALAMMDHPNIARVLDAGATENGRPYFVMELVRGIRITDYCDKNRLTMPERLELFIAICQAVQHAHQKGIIHRDIKPSNILVTSDDGKPLPKVIDFGVAKATTDIQLTDKTLFTRFEMFVGTPAYMSPEQAEFSAQGVDTRTDIYALGVLLYELITGETPFDGRTLVSSGVDEMRRTIREVEPPRPSTRLRLLEARSVESVAAQRKSEHARLVAQMKGDLDWIVLKALEKDRTRRYGTAAGMALDVQRFLKLEPISARPPSAFYTFRKWSRRHRAMFLGGSAVVASLILGTGISLWLAMRARTAEQQQRELRDIADLARQDAQGRAVESRRQLIQLTVSSGNRLAESGAVHSALLWFVEALRLVQGDQAAEDINRRRYAALRRFAPRLDYAAAMDGGVNLWFTADGQRLAGLCGADQGFLREARGGKLLAEGLFDEAWRRGTPGHELPADAAGLALTALPAPGGFKVRDGFAGRDTGLHLECPPEVSTVVFSRDGRRAVATDGKAQLYAWELDTGVRYIHNPDVAGSLLHPTISSDGSRVAALTRGASFDVTVWDFATGAPVLDLKHPAGDVMDCRISPDGQRLAVGSWDGYARIYDVATGQPIGDAMRHGRGVASVTFTPDGQRLVTTSWDNTLRLWDVRTGLPASPSLQSTTYVPVVRLSPDGSLLAALSLDRNLRVWDIARTGPQPRLAVQHGGPLTVAAISPDALTIATAGLDSRLRLWRAADGARLAEVDTGGSVRRAVFSPDCRLLAIGLENGGVELRDAGTGKGVRSMTCHTKYITSLSFSRDGTRLVSAGRDGLVQVWTTAEGTACGPAWPHEGSGLQAVFSPDGRRVLTWSRDGTARVWPVGAAAPAVVLRLPGQLSMASFDPTGTRVLTAPTDNLQDARSAQVWDAATGEPLGPPLPQRDGVLAASFSPDGKWIATASEDCTAIVWEAATGRPVAPPMRHLSYIWQAVFSPDSRLLLTASMDRTVRVWDVLTGEPVTPPLPHAKGVMEPQWLAGGREIFTFSADGMAAIWDLSPATESLAELQLEAEILSSHRLVPGMGPTPLTSAEVRERWQVMRPGWK